MFVNVDALHLTQQFVCHVGSDLGCCLYMYAKDSPIKPLVQRHNTVSQVSLEQVTLESEV